VSILATLTAAIESRDPYLRGHSARVSAYAESVARRLGWDSRRIAVVGLGGALHDVGKIAVDVEVLRKPGPLDPDELAQIQRHPEAGAQLLHGIADFKHALPCVLYHHERWDGSGYPTGRAGTRIPVEARLLAVADAFDAMTSPRPYRAALTSEQALGELERCAGTQFDPKLARGFVDAWRVRVQGGGMPSRAVAR
jgi:HD-GYP domain-containing protein (c-di-GMP phosphodiesterase class II)